MEEFKPIDGTSYSISTLGRVRNDITGRILIPWNRGEYLAVNLGIRNPFYVHRLVGYIFLTPIEGYVLDHINRNKHDNRLINLRFIPKSENAINTLHNSRNILKEKNISRYKNRYWVRIYRNGSYAFINAYDSLDEAIVARNNFLNTQ